MAEWDITWGQDVTQVVGHSAVKVWIPLHGRSILPAESICSLGYFPLQPVVGVENRLQIVHNWSIKGCGMCSPVLVKVHNKITFCIMERVAFVATGVSSKEICHNDLMPDVQ